MHKDIVEHISRDRGYNEGFKAGKIAGEAIKPGTLRSNTPDWLEGYESGRKRAWDLMGELAEYYKKQLNPNPLAPPHQCDLEHGRWQAALYAQMVIKQDNI